MKDRFRQESCLQVTQKWNLGKAANVTKHPMSAHKLNIEAGRYQYKVEREGESKKELYDDSSDEGID